MLRIVSPAHQTNTHHIAVSSSDQRPLRGGVGEIDDGEGDAHAPCYHLIPYYLSDPEQYIANDVDREERERERKKVLEAQVSFCS